MTRRTRITRVGWLYLGVVGFVVFGAVLREINLLLLLAGLLVGLAVWSWTTRLWLRRLAVRRTVPPRAATGDVVPVTIALANRRRFASWAVTVDDLVMRDGAVAPVAAGHGRVFFPCVPAGETATGTYHLRPLSRGRYRLGPLVTQTRFPLGLLVHWAPEAAAATLLVGPPLGRLTRAWRRIEQADAVAAEPLAQQRARADGDYYGLRDWRAGDSRRRIHWRTSARRGRLVVRQFEAHSDADLAVLVDLWQPREPTDADLRRVELAASFAATLAADACRRGGARLSLVVAGHEVRQCQGWASGALLDEAIELLALAEAHPNAGDALPDDERPAGRHITITTRPMAGSAVPTGDDAPAATAGERAESTRIVQVDGPDFALWFEAPPWPSAT